MLCSGEKIEFDTISSQNYKDQEMWCQRKLSSLSKLYEGRVGKEECVGVFGNFGKVGGGVHAEGEDDAGGEGEGAEDENYHDVQPYP